MPFTPFSMSVRVAEVLTVHLSSVSDDRLLQPWNIRVKSVPFSVTHDCTSALVRLLQSLNTSEKSVTSDTLRYEPPSNVMRLIMSENQPLMSVSLMVALFTDDSMVT